MSDCLHCDINELVTKYAERPDSDASELAARMAESLVDLILMAPESDRAALLADVIAVLGQLYLEKSGVVEPGESTAQCTRPRHMIDNRRCPRPPICASASTSITSRPSATRAAAGIPIPCGRRRLRSRPAPTASPRICARIAGTSATTTSRASRRRSARPLNLEMAATDEMVAIAIKTRPHAACLVPERREEAHHRGRSRCRWAAQSARAGRCASSSGPASACRCSSPPIPRQIEIAARLRRAGDRNPHRRLVRCAGRRAAGGRRGGGVCAHSGRREACARPSASKSMPGMDSNYETAETIAALAGNRRTQHRPFPGRRGDLRSGLPKRCGSMRAAMDRGRRRSKVAR